MLAKRTYTTLRYYSQFAHRLSSQNNSHHTYTILSTAHINTYTNNLHSSQSTTQYTNRTSLNQPILLPFHPFCTTTSNTKTQTQSNPTKVSNKDDDKPTLKLSFRETIETIRSGNIGGTEFKRLLDFTRPESKWILGGIGCMVVSTSVTMIVPAAFGYIIDIATGAKTGFSLMELSMLFSSLFVTGGVFNAMRVYAFTRVGHNIVRRIRHSLFDNITRQEVEFFDRTSTGELINRLSSDTTIMGESLGGLQLSALLRSFAQIVGSFSVMMYLSPDLSIAMTTLIPVGIFGSIGYGRFVRDTQQKTQDALSQSTSFAEEKLLQIRTVRYFANENIERETYFDKINKVYDLAMLQTKGSSIFFGSTGAIGNVFLLGVLLYGAHLVQAGIITSGLLTSCLLYSVYIAMSAVGITSSFAGIMRGIGASKRVFELIDRETKINNEIGLELLHSINDLKGDINFKHINFYYPTREESIILNNFNLIVPSGKAIALVGESGSGKSTIISLLLRFYDINNNNNGQISIDGYNIKDLKPDFIRKQIGVVSQEPVLFTGSIKDNILYGLSDINDININNIEHEMYKVSMEANAHDFIMDFPDKYMTQIGEGGTNLSGGQKQRIAIARALIKKPNILLLDEATSALDSTSEKLVADALQKSMKNRTTIVIAHRLSTIKNVNIIAVLKDGEIVEIGNHDELVNKPNSYYQKLIQTQ